MGFIIFLGIFSYILAMYVPINSIIIALLIGIIIGNSRYFFALSTRVGKSESFFLPLAIVCLGSEIQLQYLKVIGVKSIIFIVLIFFITLLIGYGIARLFKFSHERSLLLSSGNAVCGSAAVIAVSSVIHANKEDTALTIGVVNLMGSIALIFIPMVLLALGSSTNFSGYLIGGTFQSVGQTIAAGFVLGSAVGKLTLLVKMGRVLLLIPVVLVLGRHNRSKKLPVPPFIIGFFAVSAVTSISWFPTVWIGYIHILGNILLSIAMVAIGSKIHIVNLKKSGVNLLCAECLIFVVQIIVATMLIYLLRLS